MPDHWLTPNYEDAEQRAMRKRLATEESDIIYKAVAQLEEELERKSKPIERTEPTLIEEREEPTVIAERETPKVLNEYGKVDDDEKVAATPQPDPKPPDKNLVEIVQIYFRLTERDKLELLMFARVKAHFDKEHPRLP